jgi:ubiquinone/menaquinone biosynthesis C-methylase UbiE
MIAAELHAALDRLATITDAEWQASLSERKRRELAFHDEHRDRARAEALRETDQDTYERFYANRKYYDATTLSKTYVDDWIRHEAPGKVFLDYACGNGQFAIKAARAGAALALGLDISAVSVQNAAADAVQAGVAANARFVQGDAENTRLPAACIDRVMCNGMLHHLDLSYAFPELRRVVKPGGRILAVEALDYNPAIKLYRWLTPQMRTAWERAHILSLADVEFARRFFDVGEVRFWHITSMAGVHLRPLMPLLDGIDKMLTALPYVQRLAWIFTFELIRRED